jgi:hypothetical protein
MIENGPPKPRHVMRRPVHPSVTAAFVALLASTIAAILLTARQQTLAESDLLVVLAYAIGFATLLGAIFRRFESRFKRLSPNYVYVSAMALGALIAFAWHAILGSVMGDWVMAVGIPVYLCWLAGGFSAGIALARLHSKSNLHLSVAIVVCIMVLLLATDKALADPRKLTVVLNGNASGQFFRSVIGTPDSTPTAHGFVDGVVGASMTERSGSREVIEVQLGSYVSHARVKALTARIRSYPPVKSVTGP